MFLTQEEEENLSLSTKVTFSAMIVRITGVKVLQNKTFSQHQLYHNTSLKGNFSAKQPTEEK